LEAWIRGVPVAMSNIPPFLEHLEVQQVKAEVFDPREPQDIAKKIAAILNHPEKALEDARQSQMALKKLTWEQVAENYLAIFDRAIKS
jgi:glycosyltransferase involved in cell wall biosynthesis